MASSGVLTNENLESCSRDKVEYSFKIRNFLGKARALEPGKGKIQSKTLMIQSSTFQVELFLNGKDHRSEGTLFIKIKNLSCFPVRVKAHLCFASLGGEHVFSKRYLAASQDSKQNFMASSFQHSSLYLTSGGSLKMEIMIKLYDEIYSNKIFDLAALKEEVHELSRQMKLLVSSVSSMRLFSGPWLECPVCYEEVKPPMRLKHCAQGHIICDSCHSKTGADGAAGALNKELCHTCRMIYLGRPAVLENLLGLTNGN